MTRVVLDTNIVLSGFFWNASRRRLLAANPPTFVRYTSTPLIEELEDVLARQKFAARIALSPLSLQQLVESYLQSTTLVTPRHLVGIAPDPDDDVVIGTALAAHAEPSSQEIMACSRSNGINTSASSPSQRHFN